MKCRTLFASALTVGLALGLAGCSTEPSGGQLPPPPPPVPAEEYKEQANKSMQDMYSKMGKAPGAPTPKGAR